MRLGRWLGRITLAAGFLACAAPVAGAVGVAYIDGGNVQVASVDGQHKAALTSDGTVAEGTARIYEEVAQTTGGHVFASSRNCSPSPCVHAFSQYNALGAKVSEYFPGWDHNGPAPVFPLGFDVTASGSNIGYGFLTVTNFPSYSQRRGTWVEPGDHTAAAPKPFELDVYAPTFWGDRMVGIGWSDNKAFVQDAANAPYQTTFTEWLTWGDASYWHFIRAAVAPNGTTFAFTAYDAEPDPDGPPLLALGKYTAGSVPDGTFEYCDFPTGPNPTKVTFSPDSTLMAWKDDQGVKVVAVPPVPSQEPAPTPCAPSTPTVISPTGDMPALGGVDVAALIAARNAAAKPPSGSATGPPAPGPTPGPAPGPGPGPQHATLSPPTGGSIKRTIPVGLTCDQACKLTATLTVGSATKRKARLKSTRIARGTLSLLAAGRGTLKLRIAKALARKLRRVKLLSAKLRLVVTDASGAPLRSVTVPLKLRP